MQHELEAGRLGLGSIRKTWTHLMIGRTIPCWKQQAGQGSPEVMKVRCTLCCDGDGQLEDLRVIVVMVDSHDPRAAGI